jgi:hypothetical protein
MLNLSSLLLLFSEAPKKLVDFYRQVLAREPKWQEDGFSGFECGPRRELFPGHVAHEELGGGIANRSWIMRRHYRQIEIERSKR